ncbi:MAG: hypothetical protein AB8G86_13705 [Saprospiraceae bacterium]
MDLDFLTKILAAGAMGVSIFCIFKVYNLLSTEQEKDEPRPIIIKSIHRFMTFGVVMTLLSLGIEYARHLMKNTPADNGDSNNSILINQLEKLEKEGLYSIDEVGNPEAITLTYGDKTYSLSKALQNNTLEKRELTLKKEGDNYAIIKKNNGIELKLGLLQNFDEFMPSKKDAAESALASGIYYTEADLLKIVQKELNSKKDAALAIANLTQVIAPEYKGDAVKSLKKIAVKLLIQPQLLDEGMDAIQYKNLLAAIKDIRISPYTEYESAQVYLSRYSRFGDNADYEQYKISLRDYITVYERKIRDTTSIEHQWYRHSRQVLGID